MAIAVLAIAVVPLSLIEATVPGPIPGNGISALAANWEAFCRHHYVPLMESLIEKHYRPTTEYPILLDAEFLREHMHILGATGSGKTRLVCPRWCRS